MRVSGCIVLYLDRKWKNAVLHDFNLYKECEKDLKYRMEEWDNETFFDCYYAMYDFIAQQENLTKDDDDKIREKVEELCDYIVSQWKRKLPVIDWVEWGEVNPDSNYSEVWLDTEYEVDCEYEDMYYAMKM